VVAGTGGNAYSTKIDITGIRGGRAIKMISIVGRLYQTPISLNRRFAEWSRRELSDIDGQLIRARERERTSQTPYNFSFMIENPAPMTRNAVKAGQTPTELWRVSQMEPTGVERHRGEARRLNSPGASESNALQKIFLKKVLPY
jgi:hypothetical protein